MSATLFDIIKMELEAMGPDDLMEPTSAAVEDEDEPVVGEAGVELKKLYTLWQKWEQAAMETALLARYSRRGEREIREALSTAEALMRKSELIKQFFWASVREAFGLWDKDVIGIRRGWKITWSESDESLPPFLKKLFGEL